MRLLAIAGVLPAHDIVGSERAHRLEYLGFLGMYGRVVLMHGRLHGKQRHDLEQVILNDLAQTSRGFIESATLLDSALLGHGNLHAFSVLRVPDRLQTRIAEAEFTYIHDPFLAHT